MSPSIRFAPLLAAAALFAVPAAAQPVAMPVQAIGGTRLDVVATGEVTRVPDVARVSAGVVSLAPTATEAIRQNAARMDSVRQALRRAGIPDRDIQTTALSLYPDYRQDERAQTPQLIGYRASNEVSVRFRDIANTGKILDALVAQGANQINGPMLSIDKPEQALDEARTLAIATARARAELYARALGKRVGRILSVSESGAQAPYPMPMMEMAVGRAASTKIDPGEQSLSVSVSVSFELE
ncbi:MAG TPA: SIMPL domain-containing protein [Allosphingosinicella sp.]|jgi:hypothetical protein